MSLLDLKKYHKTSYEAINPERPELSQANRTILITGGTKGIGFGISRAFIKASAERLIVLGRGNNDVVSAVSELEDEARKLGKKTLIIGKTCDVSDEASTEKLWTWLRDGNIVVDVLVLNAAKTGKRLPLLHAEQKRDSLRDDLETNVLGHLDFVQRLHRQTGKGASGKKYVVNVSTVATYMWATNIGHPTYTVTKSAGTQLVQLIADEVQPEEMQIVSMHPGGLLTPAIKSLGIEFDASKEWDHPDLPGGTAVWAASEEGKFLHGRFIWSNWDMEEVKNGAVGRKVSEDATFLKVGIEGLSANEQTLI